jgi:hypothetical protein
MEKSEKTLKKSFFEEKKMVNWIEIALFLYALAGSATTGYWFLVSFSRNFREHDRTTKLGYSVIAGLVCTGIVFFAAILLTAGPYQNTSFLETFFWLIPVSFAILMLTAAGKRAWLLIERAQYGEQGKPVPIPEEKLGTSLLARQTMAGKIPQPEPFSDSIPEKTVPAIAAGSPETTETEPEPEENAEEAEEKEGRMEESGETEKDVVAEIQRIMKSDLSEKEKQEMQERKASDLEEKEEIRKIMGRPETGTETELPSALSGNEPGKTGSSEIEKIKEELKKKIRAKETAEKIKEELKKKATRKK